MTAHIYRPTLCLHSVSCLGMMDLTAEQAYVLPQGGETRLTLHSALPVETAKIIDV